MTPPQALILLNPHAGTADEAAPLRRWAQARGHELVETRDPEDARSRAVAAAREDRLVIAAGGDGTLHGIAGALLQCGAPCPRLGVAPLGTGNDFVRSLNYPERLEEVLELIDAERVLPVDAVDASFDGEACAYLNVGSVGVAGELAAELEAEAKRRWGPLAYVWAALSKAPQASPYELEVACDNARSVRGAFLNVVVANGIYAGGGYRIAPDARLDDGLLQVYAVRDGSWLERVGVAAHVALGDAAASDSVHPFSAREVHIRALAPVPVDLDGEPRGEFRSLHFAVRSAALRILVP